MIPSSDRLLDDDVATRVRIRVAFIRADFEAVSVVKGFTKRGIIGDVREFNDQGKVANDQRLRLRQQLRLRT